jgi:methanogenic corrinoid protein MtbC1
MSMATPFEDPDDPQLPVRLAILVAAVGGDAGAAYGRVSELLGLGVSFPDILFGVLAPLEAEVGRRWQQGDFSISEEHAVTATLETVVALLAGSFDSAPDARRVVVACAEGDVHSLAARMIAAHLVFLGWRVNFLGPSQPADDLGAYLRENPPEALVLSCTVAAALPGARASIRAAHAAGVPVLAGGHGFGADGRRARALGADAWAADPREIDALLCTWQPDPAGAERGARSGGEDDQSLLRRRAAVLARAERDLVSSGSALPTADVRAHLEFLFDSLAASVLLDDVEVVAESAAWQRARLAALSAGAAAADLRQGLQAALEGDPPRAARFLEDAAG